MPDLCLALFAFRQFITLKIVIQGLANLIRNYIAKCSAFAIIYLYSKKTQRILFARPQIRHLSEARKIFLLE